MLSIIDVIKRHTSTHSTDVRAFHAALFEALQDGKLTEGEIRQLEAKREELGITDSDIDAVRMQAYLLAFAKATEDDDVTENEIDEMEQIQDYLGLSDADIAQSKKELIRMRILSEIKKGNMPVIQTDDVVLDATEIAHWSEPVELETSDKKEEPQKGMLILTSKRAIFKGPDTSIAVPLSSIIDVDYAVRGLKIHVNRKQPLSLRYRMKGDQNVVASILASAIDLRKR